jgi:uncharacterized protein
MNESQKPLLGAFLHPPLVVEFMKKPKRYRWFGQAASMAAALLLAGCAERMFYHPNRVLYWDPHAAGLEFEVVRYPSLNGNELTGLYFKTEEEPRGTVVHFHGNFGNVSNHFPQAVFLLNYGFDVLVFDYQGFGGSEGRPTRKNTVEDGLASVRFARSRLRAGSVGVFGQSVGAAVACVVAAQEADVRAAVLESPFTTYRAISRDVLKRSFITWPFSFFVPPLLVRKSHDPIDRVAAISPRPVLFVHGAADRTVPVRMSRDLHAKAGEPKKMLIIDGAGHLECQRKGGKRYQETIGSFFQEYLRNGPVP